jgi:tRNA threonylcarbamoyladenosine modification (KEOPS) complex Cgi121 subunit
MLSRRASRRSARRIRSGAAERQHHDAVDLPLKKGGNEIVFAVTEYSGGWAFWARLDR